MKASGNVDMESEFANSRYVPPLKSILEELVQQRLSIQNYPAVRDLPESHGSGAGAVTSARRRPEGSARKGGATSRWQQSNQKKSTSDETYQGGRVIVYIIGGMSYSELRVAREVMSKESKEIIAGSTIFSKPEDFIADVSRLARTGSMRQSAKSVDSGDE